MSESTRRRAGSRRRSPPAPVVAFALVVIAMTALPTAGYADQERDESDQRELPEKIAIEQTVRLDQLDVVRSRGRLIVHYAVDEADWKRLDDHYIRLWLDLRIPSDGIREVPQSRYSLPIDQRTGKLTYPELLATDNTSEVGLCLLGTGLGDQLAFGRGYICQQTRWQDVASRPTPEIREEITVELQYHRGLPGVPYTPWMKDKLPGRP